MIPRGYRHGDDLRRVHWRSTARYGELMVRREEQPHRARCTVLLDTRRDAYFGAGPDSAFEWAVSGAASVATHMLERGYAVRLLTDTGTSVPGPDGAAGFGGDSSRHGRRAAGHPRGGRPLRRRRRCRRPTRCCAPATRACWSAFLGDLDEEQAATLGRMRQRAGGAVAFVLDSDDWLARETARPARDVPARARGTAAGRRRATAPSARCGCCARRAGPCVPVRPGDTLPELWQQADRYRLKDARRGGGAVPAGAGERGRLR